MKKQYIIPIFVPHLGCPNDCTFCNQHKISGEQKNVTEEDVKKYLEEKAQSEEKAKEDNSQDSVEKSSDE